MFALHCKLSRKGNQIINFLLDDFVSQRRTILEALGMTYSEKCETVSVEILWCTAMHP